VNVSLRVTDEATGRPTPCRLHIRDEAGRHYPPLGRLAEFPCRRNEDVGAGLRQSQRSYAVIDGACEVPLPAGVPLTVEISKGLFHKPLSQVVTLKPGQLALRFTLEPWEHGAGFTQADSRCHFLTPHGAKLESAAEGLDMVNLLAVAQDVPSIDGVLYRSLSNLTAFSGQAEAFGTERGGVFVNTLNTHPVLGRMALLNGHRVVHPLTFGTLGETDDWSLGDWCGQCHRKKGLVVWADAYRPEAGLPGGEALVQAILGRVDAFEIDGLPRKAPILPAWYQLLNAGVQLALIGGSGKDSNTSPLGSVRTLTPKIGGEVPAYGEWVEHVRRGETQVTNGPVIRWTINGQPAPPALSLPEPGRVTVQAEVKSPFPFGHLELVANGAVFASAAASVEDRSAVLEAEVTVSSGVWLAVRCRSGAASAVYPQTPVFAHTSATSVTVSEVPRRRDPAAAQALAKQIGAIREWAETTGRYADPKFRTQLLADIAAALARLTP